MRLAALACILAGTILWGSNALGEQRARRYEQLMALGIRGIVSFLGDLLGVLFRPAGNPLLDRLHPDARRRVFDAPPGRPSEAAIVDETNRLFVEFAIRRKGVWIFLAVAALSPLAYWAVYHALGAPGAVLLFGSSYAGLIVGSTVMVLAGRAVKRLSRWGTIPVAIVGLAAATLALAADLSIIFFFSWPAPLIILMLTLTYVILAVLKTLLDWQDRLGLGGPFVVTGVLLTATGAVLGYMSTS